MLIWASFYASTSGGLAEEEVEVQGYATLESTRHSEC
jgi:hypothetical protein